MHSILHAPGCMQNSCSAGVACCLKRREAASFFLAGLQQFILMHSCACILGDSRGASCGRYPMRGCCTVQLEQKLLAVVPAAAAALLVEICSFDALHALKRDLRVCYVPFLQTSGALCAHLLLSNAGRPCGAFSRACGKACSLCYVRQPARRILQHSHCHKDGICAGGILSSV